MVLQYRKWSQCWSLMLTEPTRMDTGMNEFLLALMHTLLIIQVCRISQNKHTSLHTSKHFSWKAYTEMCMPVCLLDMPAVPSSRTGRGPGRNVALYQMGGPLVHILWAWWPTGEEGGWRIIATSPGVQFLYPLYFVRGEYINLELEGGFTIV